MSSHPPSATLRRAIETNPLAEAKLAALKLTVLRDGNYFSITGTPGVTGTWKQGSLIAEGSTAAVWQMTEEGGKSGTAALKIMSADLLPTQTPRDAHQQELLSLATLHVFLAHPSLSEYAESMTHRY